MTSRTTLRGFIEDLQARLVRLPGIRKWWGAGGHAGSPSSRSWQRRVISVLSIALVLGGIGVIGYPLWTNFWHDRLQARLARQLTSRQLAAEYRTGQVKVGDSLTRIQIPAIGVNTVVVQGTTESALEAGAGHYPASPLPCESGNVAIAGHRTTYGKPFTNLNLLKPGDTIELDTPIGGCVYTVTENPFVVTPNDVAVVSELADSTVKTLTLTTCNPKGSAAQRLVIRATWSKDLQPV